MEHNLLTIIRESNWDWEGFMCDTLWLIFGEKYSKIIKYGSSGRVRVYWLSDAKVLN